MRHFVALLALAPTLALAQQGSWEVPPFFFGNDPAGTDAIYAVHMVHLHTGKALVWTVIYPGPGCDPMCASNPPPPYPPSCVSRVYAWTPPSMSDPAGFPGTFESVPNCNTWMFCGGHSALADGSILAVGGMIFGGHQNGGSPESNVFDPLAQPVDHWSAGSNMAQGRWYPTATTLADGRVLACSGKNESGLYVGLPELYDPAADNWEPLPFPDGFSYYQDELYPYMFLLPDGNMVDAGPGIAYILLTSNWTWNHTNPLPSPSWPPDPPPPPGNGGSAVMYEPGKIMKCGGRLALEDSAVATTWVVNLDFTDPNNPNAGDPYNPPGWMLAGNMNFARLDHNLVVMPDGKVLALGGGTSHEFPTAVLNPEIFDPSSGTWTQQPAAATVRVSLDGDAPA